MNRLLSKIVLTIVALLAASGINAQSQEPFWLGADISGTTELEARGIQLTNAAGEPRLACQGSRHGSYDRLPLQRLVGRPR